VSSSPARLLRMRDASAKWRKENPEEARRKRKEYYDQNKEKFAVNSKKWRIAHYGDVAVLYRALQNKTKRKGLACLSFEEFAALPATCHYCGFFRPQQGCGLDRRNNVGGYEATNVLPACTVCNMMRGDRFTVSEMEQEVGPMVRRIRVARGEVPP
jgi:hypothetical protein